MPALRRAKAVAHGSQRRRDHHDAHSGPDGPAAVEPLALARRLETRAMAIALVYAISTGIGGGVGPVLFGSLLGTGDKGSLFLGYGIASALMLVAAVVAWVWGVDAEQESLEEIAEPLSATSAEAA
jgi:hypothetical protein